MSSYNISAMTFRSRSVVAHALVVAWMIGLACDADAQQEFASSKPNILFIIADDQSWKDLSVAMDESVPGSKSDYNQTPNIDSIAEAGMRFSNAYAAAPMCGPSRRALHTGLTSARVEFSESASEVEANATTLGEVMQSAGYATAHFGKWSPGAPETGLEFYDTSDGAKTNSDGNTGDPNNPKDIFGITERAIEFMEESVNEGRPFYMQLSHFAPHVAITALDATIDKWKSIKPGKVHTDPAYAAMHEDLDNGIGMLLEKLRDLGVERNTFVIYTSDHGQTINLSPNLPLKYGKGSLWEGGMRVPFIVSGPGITPGTSSRARVVSLDLFPTFAELAGGTAPDGLEGGSLLPVLRNAGDGEVQRAGEGLVFHFPQPSGQPNSRGVSSIYLGDYKLMRFYDTEEVLLFDIHNDLGEQQNLADQMPDRVKDMQRRMTSYLDSVNATIPTPESLENDRAAGRGAGMGRGMGGNAAMGMGERGN